MDRPAAVLRSGSRVRDGAQPQHADRRRAVDQRRQDRSHAPRGLRAGRLGQRDGVELVSVVMGTGSEGARNADTLALMDYGFWRYQRAAPLLSTTQAAPGAGPRRGDASGQARRRGRRGARRTGARRARRRAPRRARRRDADRAAEGGRGPAAGADARRHARRPAPRHRSSTACRSSPRAPLARASWYDRNRWITSAPVILLVLIARACWSLACSRARGRRQERGRRGARSEIA